MNRPPRKTKRERKAEAKGFFKPLRTKGTMFIADEVIPRRHDFDTAVTFADVNDERFFKRMGPWYSDDDGQTWTRDRKPGDPNKIASLVVTKVDPGKGTITVSR